MLILLAFIILLFLLYLNQNNNKSDHDTFDNLSDECIKECHSYGNLLTQSRCQEICDTWNFYLSSGGRLSCPPFISNELCSSNSRF